MIAFFNSRHLTLSRLTPYLLLLFILAETISCTYGIDSGVHSSFFAILYFISGIAIGVMPLFSQPALSTSKPLIKNGRMLTTVSMILLVIISVYFIFQMTLIMRDNVIDYKVADMLPQIKAMCQRLIHQQQVYAPIQEIWNGKQPPYMPLMWIPFAPAEWLGIDVRWTTTIFILGGLFLTYKILPTNKSSNPLIVAGSFISLCILLNFILRVDPFTMSRTEEGVVIGYYLLLAFALATRNTMLTGIAIACCLLSRFSLFFWVPMYLVFVFIYESRQKAYILVAVIATILLFIFLIPYGFRQPEYFMNIPSDYHVGVDNAWKSNYSDGGYYQHFLGYARYFDISQIELLHRLQIIVAVILPVLLISGFALFKKRVQFNAVFFGICSLKLVLVFFYNMVEVPYHYLFYVSTFFSYAILMMYLRETVKPPEVQNQLQYSRT